MGQAESSPSSTSIEEQFPTGGTTFHVLRVAEQSPAAQVGIDPFFDFLCGVNGTPLGEEMDDFTRLVERNERVLLVLQVWSTKRREMRNVQVVPSRSWAIGVAGSARPSLLGLSLRVCKPQHALEQVWHVLEILEGSPAESAGLVPFGDWIVGYAGGVLRGEGDFYDIVESHVDKPLRLFVYNADYDVTREAILVPNRAWGGEGLLGCGVGYGLLHRIPKPQDRVAPSSENELNESYHQNLNEPLGQEQGGQQIYQEGREQQNPRSGARRSDRIDSSGFSEASYSNEGSYGASEGVQVIPTASSQDEDDDYSPSLTSASGGQYSNKPGGGGGGRGLASIPPYRAPPISPSAFGRGGVGLIEEEEE